MKTWVRHYAELRKGPVIAVIEQTYDGNRPQFKRKRIKARVVKFVPVTEQIPLKEYTRTKQHYDFGAIQSSDREWSEEYKFTAPDRDVVERLKQEALRGLNTEPIEKIDSDGQREG